MVIVKGSLPPQYSDYRRFKPFLRRDFHHSCAFCLLPEVLFGGQWEFAVEHLRPKSLPRFASLASDYRNLYYSCKHCNTFKHACWPTNVEEKLGFRFVDPCVDDPYDHFLFSWDGTVTAQTNAARYTIAHLRLNRKQVVALRSRLADAVNRYLVILHFIAAHLARLEGRHREMEQVLSPDELAQLRDARAAQEEAVSGLRELIFPVPID